MKTILTPPLPMRLRLHPPFEEGDQFRYVIGMMFILRDDIHDEVYFGFVCTNGNVYDDMDYTPECYLDDDWHDWE